MSEVPPEPMQEQPTPAPETSTKEERTWGMLCHLTSLTLFIGIPFGNIIGPLIVWMLKKDEMPFVDDQGKESLNFQLSVLIYAVISGILIFVLVGILLLIVLTVFDIIFTIIAAIKANDGVAYRYPLTIRFIK